MTKMTLINGDSLKELDNLKDKSVDLVIIDPPYLFQDNVGGGAFGSNQKKYHGQLDKISDGFDFSILEKLERVQKKVNMYIYGNKDLIFKLIPYFTAKNLNVDLLVWHKTNPPPMCNNKYLSDIEYILFVREKGVPLYGTYASKKKLFQSPTNKKDKKLFKHPTPKLVDHLKRLIENSSKEGDTVLDCFSGSGSTGVACKQLKRNFIGIELELEYFNVAKERIEKDLDLHLDMAS